MVANNCNGACAHRAAILALIIPRWATKGLYDDLPTMWVKKVSAILIRQHTRTSNCINDPRHTVSTQQSRRLLHRYKNMISLIPTRHWSTQPPPHSPPLPHCLVNSLGVQHLSHSAYFVQTLQWFKWIQQNEPGGQHSLNSVWRKPSYKR